jgi:death-on-curing protein
VRDHPFIDENKRTAFLVAEAFCHLNDWWLAADDVESIIIFRALAADEIEEDGLAKWLERHLKKMPGVTNRSSQHEHLPGSVRSCGIW